MARFTAAEVARVFDRWVDVNEMWFEVADFGDLEYYTQAVRAVDGVTVELGVGDGRVASRTHPDFGIDLAVRSLEVCAQKLGPDAPTELICGDFVDYRLPEPAALSYAPLNTFNHVISADQRVTAFRNVLMNTQLGGELLFDCYVSSREIFSRYNRVIFRQAHTDGWVLYLSDEVLDWEALLCLRHAVIEKLNEDGIVTQRRHAPALPHVCIAPEVIEQELRAAGWSKCSVFGDFEGGAFTEASRKQVWSARRLEGG